VREVTSSHCHCTVAGAADGLVRFFDSMLRMCAWFEELDAGPVGCLSFATKGQQRPQAVMQMHRYAGYCLVQLQRLRGMYCSKCMGPVPTCCTMHACRVVHPVCEQRVQSVECMYNF
jgi:hypothetical protein